jgi:methyltransferase-like protein
VSLENILDFTAYIIFVIVVAVLLIGLFRSTSRSKRLANSLIQSEINSHALKEKFEEISIRLESIELQKTDEFVKFLSESRDWAFQYIEDVQGAIVYLKNALDSGSEEQINNAYSNLIELLPKEESSS